MKEETKHIDAYWKKMLFQQKRGLLVKRQLKKIVSAVTTLYE